MIDIRGNIIVPLALAMHWKKYPFQQGKGIDQDQSIFRALIHGTC